ncbi:sensor histidine kinase [Embleya sp. AB8]|uniref:sensor histidine kinase n=1 Tax=Embleya sp. AB8 TaxID=3156304 RepID=UPI003C769F62
MSGGAGTSSAVRAAWWGRRLAEFLRRPGPFGVDLLLAPLAIGAALWIDLNDGGRGQLAGGAVLVLPLLLRLRAPVPMLAAQVLVACTTSVGADAVNRTGTGVVWLLIGAYAVAVYHRGTVSGIAVLAAAAVALAVRFEGDQLLVFTIMALVWLFGRRVASWRNRAGEMHERAVRAERERDTAARLAVAEERARIAREFHDVVSHTVSVMVIQSGAARTVLRTNPDAAETALRVVEAGGREAMAELRQLLGVLAVPEGDLPSGVVGGAGVEVGVGVGVGFGLGSGVEGWLGPLGDDGGSGSVAPLEPQPGVDRLPELVGRVRDTGRAVEVVIEGDPRPVSAGVDLAVYRVVQEALTNALRYAGDAAIGIVLAYGAREVTVEVVDDGNGAADSGFADRSGLGRGLLGLGERVGMYGGELRAGPRLTGGYRVFARIPLDAE